MSRASIATVLAVALLALPAAGRADDSFRVKAGAEKLFDGMVVYGQARCMGGALPTVVVRDQPAHGTIRFEKAEMTTKEGPCAGKPMKGIRMFYRANGGYRGPDRFTLEVQTEIWVHAAGLRSETTTWTVTVD